MRFKPCWQQVYQLVLISLLSQTSAFVCLIQTYTCYLGLCPAHFGPCLHECLHVLLLKCLFTYLNIQSEVCPYLLFPMFLITCYSTTLNLLPALYFRFDSLNPWLWNLILQVCSWCIFVTILEGSREQYARINTFKNIARIRSSQIVGWSPDKEQKLVDWESVKGGGKKGDWISFQKFEGWLVCTNQKLCWRSLFVEGVPYANVGMVG
jgi:hypothetical protein